MKITKKSDSENETIKFAEIVAKKIKLNSIICLNGPLGSGKTFFARNFGKFLGCKEIINSPTFIIVKKYEFNKIKLFHIDAQRLNVHENLDFLRELFFEDNILIIEWAENIMPIIPRNNLTIYFEYVNLYKRELVFESEDSIYLNIMRAILKA